MGALKAVYASEIYRDIVIGLGAEKISALTCMDAEVRRASSLAEYTSILPPHVVLSAGGYTGSPVDDSTEVTIWRDGTKISLGEIASEPAAVILDASGAIHIAVNLGKREIAIYTLRDCTAYIPRRTPQSA